MQRIHGTYRLDHAERFGEATVSDFNADGFFMWLVDGEVIAICSCRLSKWRPSSRKHKDVLIVSLKKVLAICGLWMKLQTDTINVPT